MCSEGLTSCFCFLDTVDLWDMFMLEKSTTFSFAPDGRTLEQGGITNGQELGDQMENWSGFESLECFEGVNFPNREVKSW